MLDITIDEKQVKRTIERFRERNIILPTFKQMKNPELVPDKIAQKLKDIGLWDVASRNLFLISWKNDMSNSSAISAAPI